MVKNASCLRHDSTQISGWLIEAALVAMPFHTPLKIAVISIRLLLTGRATVCSLLLLTQEDKCILL